MPPRGPRDRVSSCVTVSCLTVRDRVSLRDSRMQVARAVGPCARRPHEARGLQGLSLAA